MDAQACNEFIDCEPPTTPIPLPTLGPVAKVIVEVVQTLGCTALIVILSATLAALIFLRSRILLGQRPNFYCCEILRNFQLERLLMMNVQVSLLAGHILIMTGRDNYGNWVKMK